MTKKLDLGSINESILEHFPSLTINSDKKGILKRMKEEGMRFIMLTSGIGTNGKFSKREGESEPTGFFKNKQIATRVYLSRLLVYITSQCVYRNQVLFWREPPTFLKNNEGRLKVYSRLIIH